MTTIEKLNGVVNSLTKTKDITSVAVVSKGGLLIVSNVKSDHAQTFAAMAATMFISAETATTEIGGWTPDRVVVESDDCKLITVTADPKSLLVVMTEANVNLGIVLHDMKVAADEVNDILS
ncbi:MAG: roadblock/LC7 domain-containing protein [Methanosarcinaceae archaeon]|nr:roadblock/LC7 domain-containing protein [Methanosarcinaceae archaeon]